MFRSHGFSPQPSSDRIFTGPTSSTDELVQKLPKVLVVDDDGDSLFLLGHILSQFVCEATVETEGPAALERIRLLQPNLILLDIWLPGMNGLDIARTLRREAATKLTPIVAVTALASNKDREQILRAGCTQYISKPYNLDDMEAILSGYLQRLPVTD